MLPKEHFALTATRDKKHRPSDLLLRKDGHPGQQHRSVSTAVSWTNLWPVAPYWNCNDFFQSVLRIFLQINLRKHKSGTSRLHSHNALISYSKPIPPQCLKPFLQHLCASSQDQRQAEQLRSAQIPQKAGNKRGNVV